MEKTEKPNTGGGGGRRQEEKTKENEEGDLASVRGGKVRTWDTAEQASAGC